MVIPTTPRCRACGCALTTTFADLGSTPLANAYVDPAQAPEVDIRYPLHARVCSMCLLVQVDDVVPPEVIFSEYAYFSSYSDSWVRHAAAYCDEAVARLPLSPESLVIEVASNDGYLLQHLIKARMRVLGIEPAANVVEVAVARGVPTLQGFFGRELAARVRDEHGQADLIVMNNVVAHVPDLIDFLTGVEHLLAPGGTATIEAPHLQHLIKDVQFDTIYHEHFSYFSLASLASALADRGLAVYDVERFPTHGGSLRYWVGRTDEHRTTDRVAAVAEGEGAAGLHDLDTYRRFGHVVKTCVTSIRTYLADARDRGRTIVGYGAAAKGNTLLNVAGATADDLAFVVDRSPHKQGKLLPGSRLAVRPVEALLARQPDDVLLLAWNLHREIISQLPQVRAWGGRFVVPVPELRVL